MSVHDLEALQARLQNGPTHWSSLDELAQTPEFEAWAGAEFPAAWSEARVTDVGRRDFLKLMGASMGLAGLSSACVRQPEETIVPYVNMPEELVPGKPIEFSTAFEQGGYGLGLLAETHMYRPTHLRGSPDHPDSLGGIHPQAQASILSLWDPDRSRQVRRRGNVATWKSFASEMSAVLDRLQGHKGRGLAILTGATSSPTRASLMDQVMLELPEARLYVWEPISRYAVYAGTRMAFGSAREARYRLDQAQTIFAVDADFMGSMPGAVRHQAQVLRRRNDQSFDDWSRVYVAEATPTVGGSIADHRLRVRPSQAGPLLAAVAGRLGVSVSAPDGDFDPAFVDAVAQDLKKAGRDAAIVVGDHQPAEVHALSYAVLQKLGALHRTVVFTEPVLARVTDPVADLRSMVEAMNAGEVDTAVLLDRNPVYDAPGDLDFAAAYQKVKLRIHASPYEDETSTLSQWHIPTHHYLESWGDVRSTDGTVTIRQPSLQPLYETRSIDDVLALLTKDGKEATDYDRVRQTWSSKLGDAQWRRALHDGTVGGSALPTLGGTARAPESVPSASFDDLEVQFVADPNLHDGRHGHNAWLLELPQPMSKLTWDNAVLLSPATAKRLSVEPMDEVELTANGRTVKAPVWVLPGQADDVATVNLGWGRTRSGAGSDHGFDANQVRSSASPYVASGSLRKTGKRWKLACTQDHFRMLDRGIVRGSTVEHYQKDPSFVHARESHMPKLSLWEPYAYKGYKWGMTINLSACSGCNACVVACQSENNIAVVGKEEVALGREMHWIRVDRYFSGSVEDPQITNQPVTCQMCENAPCETVCPVNATVHGPMGLNQMVYNRCVGTRYCSNNCPYKVRRFNFRLYSEWYAESRKGQRNPDVTVRSRGVMEKCTYCVQRINRARIESTVDGKDQLVTDSVQTACQEACPTRAISFGDLNDPKADVARKQKLPLSYAVLGELNTKPRTTYLARLTHANPRLAPPAPDGGHGHGHGGSGGETHEKGEAHEQH